MSAPFAALEARVNAAVFKRLSNASASLNGAAVSGMFDNAYELANVGITGMASSVPVFRLLTSSVPAGVVGMPLTIGATAYTVVEHQPDGVGVSLLMLERAS